LILTQKEPSLLCSDFKPFEFDGFKNEAGSNSFVMNPKKWIGATGAIGTFSKSGRYGALLIRLIRDGLSQAERLTRLNATAIVQLKSLLEHNQVKKLNSGEKQP
jgi:hypothetical protein